jgi:hypothetical protein
MRARHYTLAFADPERLLAAVRSLRQDGYNLLDAYTPFAVHGLDEALGIAPTRLPWSTLAGGLVGLGLGLGVPIWIHAVDWPLIIGGKDLVAWPAIVPVAFEVTVLLAAFATVGALLLRSRLWPGCRNRPPDPRVTDDRFVLTVREDSGAFDPRAFLARAEALGAVDVHEVWRTR